MAEVKINSSSSDKHEPVKVVYKECGDILCSDQYCPAPKAVDAAYKRGLLEAARMAEEAADGYSAEADDLREAGKMKIHIHRANKAGCLASFAARLRAAARD